MSDETKTPHGNIEDVTVQTNCYHESGGDLSEKRPNSSLSSGNSTPVSDGTKFGGWHINKDGQLTRNPEPFDMEWLTVEGIIADAMKGQTDDRQHNKSIDSDSITP